jgi:hypothetical protein
MSTVLVVPIILLFIDSFLILHAVQLNDSTCREAARLASNGDPRLALVRAQRVVDGRNNQGPFSLQLVAAGTTVTRSQLEGLAQYGGEVSGTVNVTTEIDVKPLLISHFVPGQVLRFYANAEIPSTYVLPSAWETSANAG